MDQMTKQWLEANAPGGWIDDLRAEVKAWRNRFDYLEYANKVDGIQHKQIESEEVNP